MDDVKNTGPETGERNKDLAALLVLAALIAAVYLSRLVFGLSAMEPPQMMDVASQWLPGYDMIGRAYRAGYFPLWHSGRYAGMPWVAYSHAAVLYPPNALFISLFNMPKAVGYLHLLHALAAGMGVFLLARNLGASRLGAFMAGLGWSLSGFYFFMQSQLSNHATMAWAPLMLLCLLRALKTRALAWMLAASALMCMMVLGGDAEGFVYCMLFTALFILFVHRPRTEAGLMRAAFISSGSIALGGLLSLTIAFPVIEHYALSIRSSSSPFDLAFSGMFDSLYLYFHFLFAPWNQFRDLHPGSAFNGGLAPFYFGVLPLVLAAYAFLKSKTNQTMRGLCLLALAMFVFLVLRRAPALDSIFDKIPVLGQMYTVERSLELVQLSLLLAAALALDPFITGRGKIEIVMFLVLTGMGAIHLALCGKMELTAARALAGLALVCLGIFLFRDMTARRRSLGLALIVAALLLDLYLPALINTPRAKTSDFEFTGPAAGKLKADKSGGRFIAFSRIGPEDKDAELFGLVEDSTHLDFPFGHMRLPTWRYFEFLTLVDPGVVQNWEKTLLGGGGKNYFFTADLYTPQFLSNKNLHLLNLLGVRWVLAKDLSIRFSSPYPLMNKGATSASDWGDIETLTTKTGSRRRTSGSPLSRWFQSYLPPGSRLVFDIAWDGPDPSTDALVVVQARGKEGQDQIALCSYKVRLSPETDEPRLIECPLEAVWGKEVTVQIDISTPGNKGMLHLSAPALVRDDVPFQRVSSGQVDLYENRDALPRAFVVYASTVMDRERALSFMGDAGRFDPGRLVVFEEGAAPPGNLRRLAFSGVAESPGPTDAGYEAEGPQLVRAGARLDSAGWLFVSDAYYPGWRAYLDGAEARIWRSDLVFRSVFVPEGTHEIKMRYEPMGFRLGLWFFAGSVLGALGSSVFILMTGRHDYDTRAGR